MTNPKEPWDSRLLQTQSALQQAHDELNELYGELPTEFRVNGFGVTETVLEARLTTAKALNHVKWLVNL